MLLPFISNSQSTYSFLLNNTLSSLSCKALNNDEGGVDVIISEFTGIDYGPKELIRGYILSFDQNGDTMTYNYSFSDTLFNFGNIIQIYDGYLLTGASKFPDSLFYNLFICKLNANKEIIWTKHYSRPEFERPQIRDIFFINDEFYLCGSVTIDDPTSEYPYFLKISANGAILDEMLLPDYGQGQYRYLLSQDSSQIWLFTKCCLEPFNMASILKFNLDLNYLESESIYNDYLERLFPKWLSTNTFLISSIQNRPGASYQDDDFFIHKFDTSFNILQWNNYGSQDTSEVPGMFSAIDFKNPDSIFIAGDKNHHFGLPSSSRPTWIIAGQVDSLLQPRYINYIGGDAYYETNHMIATNDGGFFIAAAKFNFETQLYNQYFLKLNSEGILVNNKNDDLKIIQSNVWPNPVSDYLNIECYKENSRYEIYNLLGCKLAEGKLQKGKTTINASSFHSGTFILRLIIKDKVIENHKIIKL